MSPANNASGSAKFSTQKGQNLFTEILLKALGRLTFGLDLRWRSPGDQFKIIREDGTDHIRDAFRFGEGGPWLEIQAEANCALATAPLVRVRVSVPAALLSLEKALESANEVNRRGLASTHYDAAAKTLVVQHAILFTGFLNSSECEPESTFTLVHNEATLNMLATALTTVQVCVTTISQDTFLQEKQLLPFTSATPAQLNAFSIFVLSRMYRRENVSFDPGGGAIKLLSKAAQSCLNADAARQFGEDDGNEMDRYANEAVVAERVAEWFLNRNRLERAESAYFDAILFDIDRLARSQLLNLMADPPNTRPLRQLRLLEAALADCPESWAGMIVTHGTLRAALAVGLDLEIEQIPHGFLDGLQLRH